MANAFPESYATFCNPAIYATRQNSEVHFEGHGPEFPRKFRTRGEIWKVACPYHIEIMMKMNLKSATFGGFALHARQQQAVLSNK
jgi:hypothetical protein